MQNFQLLEMELRNVRPHEIEKRLELARHIREANRNRPGLRERVLLLVSDLLISFGQGLKARYDPLGGCVSASSGIESSPSGS